MWAILSDDSKRGGKWEPEEFFRSGETHVAKTLEFLAGKGIKLHYGCALDFGCGVGRLTQALGRRFEEVHGVDIAPSMIEQARGFNRFAEKVHYHVNSATDLKLFPDRKFDFICTFIVLQHIRGKFVLEYVREFVRTLRPGGVAMFQFVDMGIVRNRVPDSVVDAYRRLRHGNTADVYQYGVSRGAVEKTLREAGAKTLFSQRLPIRDRRWVGCDYVVTPE